VRLRTGREGGREGRVKKRDPISRSIIVARGSARVRVRARARNLGDPVTSVELKANSRHDRSAKGERSAATRNAGIQRGIDRPEQTCLFRRDRGKGGRRGREEGGTGEELAARRADNT